MTKEEILKIINENIPSIIDNLILLGYYSETQKKEIISRIRNNVKNGIRWYTANPEIYGIFVSNDNTIYINNEVMKDKLTLLIYFTHELIHAIDFDGISNGFANSNGYGVGINEGATQRKAEDVVKKILNIIPSIKEQESIGIKLESDLDEYQIEDKYNMLYAKALGISFESLLKLQSKGLEGLRHIEGLDALYYTPIFADFAERSNMIKRLDGIYYLQEKTWFDKNYDVNKSTISFDSNFNETGLYSRDENIRYMQDYLVRIYVFRNIMEEKINNEEEYKLLVGELISDFLIKDNSYLEKYNDYLNDLYGKGKKYIDFQNEYYETEKWIRNNINFGNKEIFNIVIPEGNGIDLPIIECHGTYIYFRENDTYYCEKLSFTYDENGTIKYNFSERKKVLFDELVHEIKENECDGNYLEYIKLLEDNGKYLEAKRIAIRYKIYEKIKNNPKMIEFKDKSTNDILNRNSVNANELSTLALDNFSDDDDELFKKLESLDSECEENKGIKH